MDKKTSYPMRVDDSFKAYAKEIQIKITEREHKVPSMTEVTRRIANECVHPYQNAGNAFKKIGAWKL